MSMSHLGHVCVNPICSLLIYSASVLQGPIRLVFDVTSAGSMPRCALNGSPYDGYDPCQDAPPPAPWDVVIVLELDMGWPGAGIIVLDRNHIRFPMNIYSDARWQLMNHGIKIPENSDKLDAFVVGHFSNVAMLNAMRCMDGSAPNPRTGVCADVLEEANRASEFLMPFPELVNGMIDIPVILPGSTELSDGFNHNGIFERFESVAVRPWLDAFGCNPFHTRGVNDPSGEIWQMSSILNDEHIAYIEKYDAFGNFVDANYDSNMWKRDMWRNYSPFEPVMPKLCRYADLWETFDGTNGGGELVLFVAK